MRFDDLTDIEPLKVFVPGDDNSATVHKRTRRGVYRQMSSPARCLTVDHKFIKKSAGRYDEMRTIPSFHVSIVSDTSS